MVKVSSFKDMKDLFQAGFEDNEETLQRFGKTQSKQLKAYLIESNNPNLANVGCLESFGTWKSINSGSWYCNRSKENDSTLFIDVSRERVWVLYSLLDANISDLELSKWLSKNQGLDRCWLTRNHLLHYGKKENTNWEEKGIGLKFYDGLVNEEDSSHFSLKAWFGIHNKNEKLNELLNSAKEQYAINSVRWQKRFGETINQSAEWYSNGKVTINRASDVNEVIITISDMANKYEDSLLEATKNRDEKMAPFEIEFTQEIDLSLFSRAVNMGKSNMNLWLVETESQKDFKRFQGVDLHTWDRIIMDIGLDYAYITIPGKGCVNAAPRIATIQGEDNAGKTTIYFDGNEIFT